MCQIVLVRLPWYPLSKQDIIFLQQYFTQQYHRYDRHFEKNQKLFRILNYLFPFKIPPSSLNSKIYFLLCQTSELLRNIEIVCEIQQ